MKPLPMRPMRSLGLVMSKILVDDEIGVEAAGEEVEHVLHGGRSHPLARLLRQAGDMRRQHDLVESEQADDPRRRLVVEYVEASGGDPAIREGRRERPLVDDPAARGVDDNDARLDFSANSSAPSNGCPALGTLTETTSPR